jgi:monovalent cation/proton antiporter MnhG/PhaG subunit
VIAAFFLLVGAIGLARLPDFFMRLHAPTKASTLGVGGVLIASMLVAFSQGRPGIQPLYKALKAINSIAIDHADALSFRRQACSRGSV